MSEHHNPRACPRCGRQAAELRHPAYRPVRHLLAVPAPRRGGAA